MKMILGAVVILVLMIGAQSAYALTDTEKEAGIASDAQGRVCNYGANHDECHDQFLRSKDYQRGFLQGVHDIIHHHYTTLWASKYSYEYGNGYNHGLTAGYNATLRKVN